MTPTPNMEETNTVFIDNLSESTNLGTLWRTFHPFGRITSVHRPMKRRVVTSTRYAFVAYVTSQQARMAIEGTNDLMVDGVRISTQFARPLRKVRSVSHQSYRREVESQPPPPSQAPLSSRATPWSNEEGKIAEEKLGGPVLLSPSGVMIPRLDRSIVMRSKVKTSVEQLWEIVAPKEAVEKVICQSNCEYLVIFKDKKGRHNFLDKGEWSEDAWSVEEWAEARPRPSRIANVAIRGLPPQAWSVESVRSILGRFGNVEEIQTEMNECPVNLEVFATLKTNIYKIINEDVDVIFDNTRTTVGVVEVWSEELGESLAAAHQSDGGEDEGIPMKSQKEGNQDDLADTLQWQSPHKHDSPKEPGDMALSITKGSTLHAAKPSHIINYYLSKEQMGSVMVSINGRGLRKVNLNGRLTRFIGSLNLEFTRSNRIVEQELVSSTWESCPVLWKTAGRGQWPVIDNEIRQTSVLVESVGSISIAGEDRIMSDFSSHNASETAGIGLTSSPNKGTPTPIEGLSPPEINLQVLISPDSETSHKQSINPPKFRVKRQKQNFARISAEARQCFKYGQRLRIHCPYPRKSLSNIDRILRQSKARN